MHGLHESRALAAFVARIHVPCRQAADVLLLSTTAAFTWEGLARMSKWRDCRQSAFEGFEYLVFQNNAEGQSVMLLSAFFYRKF